MSTPTFTKSGTKHTTSAKLDKTVFSVEVKNLTLIQHAYTAYLANGRANLAKTLKRGEVRGGGKKPWRQKGTGRARFGSSRVPIWRGGGIVFGPSGQENYTKSIPVQAKRTALRQALSLKNAKNEIYIIEDLSVKSGKTKDFVQLLSKMNISGRTLVIVDDKTPEIRRATANLQEIQLVQATYLNVYDTINADAIIMTEKALSLVTNLLSNPIRSKETS